MWSQAHSLSPHARPSKAIMVYPTFVESKSCGKQQKLPVLKFNSIQFQHPGVTGTAEMNPKDIKKHLSVWRFSSSNSWAAFPPAWNDEGHLSTRTADTQKTMWKTWKTVNVMKPYETLTNLTTCPDFYLKLEWTDSVRKQYKKYKQAKIRQLTARSSSPDKSYKS